MYYKTLGYITHNVLRWQLKRRMPAREQVTMVAAVGATTLIALGVASATMRSRRTVPTV